MTKERPKVRPSILSDAAIDGLVALIDDWSRRKSTDGLEPPATLSTIPLPSRRRSAARKSRRRAA